MSFNKHGASAGRILATLPSARLACLNILKLGRLTIDTTLDAQGHFAGQRVGESGGGGVLWVTVVRFRACADRSLAGGRLGVLV